MVSISREVLTETASRFDNGIGKVTKFLVGEFDDGVSLFSRARQDTGISIKHCLADLTEENGGSFSVALWSGFKTIEATLRGDENLMNITLDIPNQGRIVYGGSRTNIDLAAVVLTACCCLPDKPEINNSALENFFSYGGGRIVLSATNPERINGLFDGVVIRLNSDEDAEVEDNLLKVDESVVKGIVDESLTIMRDQEKSPLFLVIDQSGGLSGFIETYCRDLRIANTLKNLLKSVNANGFK